MVDKNPRREIASIDFIVWDCPGKTLERYDGSRLFLLTTDLT